jgi:hypothetical protein
MANKEKTWGRIRIRIWIGIKTIAVTQYTVYVLFIRTTFPDHCLYLLLTLTLANYLYEKTMRYKM